MSTTEDKPSAETKETPQVKTEPVENEPKAEAKVGDAEEAKPADDAAPAAKSDSATTVKSESATAANGEKKKGLRLTNADKRKYKWLIGQGLEREAALKLLKKPMSKVALRKFVQRKLNPDTVKQNIRMAVTTVDFPASTLNMDQAKNAKAAILKQVLQQKDTNQKPHFQDCVYINGYLLVHCRDQATVKWLQHSVPKLEHWKGPDLKAVSERTLSKSEPLIGIFTESGKDPDKDILDFIESQNEGLNTSKWRIVKRKELPRNKAVELMFTVDAGSFKKLENSGFELNYKFNKVTLRKRTEEGRSGAVAKGNAQPRRNPNDKSSFRNSNSYGNRMSSQSGMQRQGGGFNRSRSPPRRNVWSGDRDRNFDRNRFSGSGSRYGGGNQYGENSYRSSSSYGGNSNRSSSSFGGNSYRSSSSYGSGNSPFATNGNGTSAFQSSNNQLPGGLVDNLYNLVRSVTGGGQNALGLNLGQNSSRNSYGSRTGFF